MASIRPNCGVLYCKIKWEPARPAPGKGQVELKQIQTFISPSCFSPFCAFFKEQDQLLTLTTVSYRSPARSLHYWSAAIDRGGFYNRLIKVEWQKNEPSCSHCWMCARRWRPAGGEGLAKSDVRLYHCTAPGSLLVTLPVPATAADCQTSTRRHGWVDSAAPWTNSRALND